MGAKFLAVIGLEGRPMCKKIGEISSVSMIYGPFHRVGGGKFRVTSSPCRVRPLTNCYLT
jgi:hypothetical protein